MNFLMAFLIGGALCALAQLLLDLTDLTPAQVLVSYVVLGVVFGGFGVYGKLVDLCGGGATVPISGFGNCLAEGVRKAVDEKGLIGAFTGGLEATAGGITVAMVSALVLSFFFKSKEK